MAARTGLARVLGLGDLSVLSSASMAPAYSIASTFGLMVAATGGLAPLALVALAIPIVFIAVAFHRLCEERPNAGSTYAWSRLAFGSRFGVFAAWIVVLSYFFSAVAAVVPAGIYTLSLVLPKDVDSAAAVAIVGGIWVVVASVLLIGGVRPTARTSGIFLLLEVAALLIFAGIALRHPLVGQEVGRPNLTAPMYGGVGISGFLTAMVLAIWVTDGWEVSTYASEENSGTSRQPGLGGLIALIGTVAIMLLCILAFMRVAPLAELSNHAGDTLAYVAQQLGGGWRSIVMLITVLVSTAATLWTTQLGISRGMFSMSRDGVFLFPKALTAVHPRFGTPWISIVAANVGVLIVALVAGFSVTAGAALSHVITASSVFLGLTFILTGAACVRHFRTRGVPATDLTRVVLPSIGTLAVSVLLVLNFHGQTRTDQIVAGGCVALGIAYALAAPTRLRSTG